MARDFAKQFYSSAAWKKCRAAYIAMRASIDGGMCEICHDRPGYIVHHKIWLTEDNINDPSITLDFDNLRYECLNCHNLEDEGGGFKMPPNMTRVRFDQNGEPYEIPSGPRGNTE